MKMCDWWVCFWLYLLSLVEYINLYMLARMYDVISVWKKATIDDITMTKCCMIMMGFGPVWEHDNHALNVMGLRGHAE